MKKSLIISAILFFSFSSAFSQSLHFGAKLGANLSGISGYSNVNTSNIVGVVGGFYLRAKLLGFFVQPEIVYSQKGGKYTGNITNIAGNTFAFARTETS